MADSTAVGSFKHIGNKEKRTSEYRKYRAGKRKEKLARRIEQAKEERGPGGEEIKRARLAANKTRTIENTRVHNPTIVSEPNTHPGLKPSNAFLATQQQQLDDEEPVASGSSVKLPDNVVGEDIDAQAAVEDAEAEVEDEEGAQEAMEAWEDAAAPPAILITTSGASSSTSPHLASANARTHPAERTRDFIDELLNMFPGGEYRPRAKAKGASLGKIASWARKRGYNSLISIGEDHKEPTMLTIVNLPDGPTATFRLTNVQMGKQIYHHARATPHSPELILNNFTTTLGHRIGSLLQSLFPKLPQLEGRQALTAHNQRDFIFFRRHRYDFVLKKGEEKARLQEIGPRFTIKLRKLVNGLPKGAGGWDGVVEFDGDKSKEEAEQDQVTGPSSAAGAKRKRSRGEVEETTTEFQWKPKMGVSRRNFYL